MAAVIRHKRHFTPHAHIFTFNKANSRTPQPKLFTFIFLQLDGETRALLCGALNAGHLAVRRLAHLGSAVQRAVTKQLMKLLTTG